MTAADVLRPNSVTHGFAKARVPDDAKRIDQSQAKVEICGWYRWPNRGISKGTMGFKRMSYSFQVLSFKSSIYQSFRQIISPVRLNILHTTWQIL